MGELNWIDRAVAEYLAGRPLALLFDYDGTLAPIAPHPGLATLPETTRALLAALAGTDRVAVGVLSGRALGHLKDMVALAGVRYAGSGGMHLDLAGAFVADEAVDEFDRVAESLMVAISGPVRWFPGTWVERKPGCLSVHYRQLTPLKSVCFCEEVRDALAFLGDAAPPLRVRDVTQALEITLAGAWTKGEAVNRMLADLSRDVFPVYAGDGANDEEAVARVNDLGGLTIGVGAEHPPEVRVRVPTPAAFAVDLGRLLGGLARPDRAPPSGETFTPSHRA